MTTFGSALLRHGPFGQTETTIANERRAAFMGKMTTASKPSERK